LKYTFLSKRFYEHYTQDKYPQIVTKGTRPYAHIKVTAKDMLFCLPLRSNIEHPHAYFTNKKEKCGVDYSKAVVITKEEYVDYETKVFLRPEEYRKLKGKDYIITKQFLKYIDLYKKAKKDKSIPHREDILKFSTLQYFEAYI